MTYIVGLHRPKEAPPPEACSPTGATRTTRDAVDLAALFLREVCEGIRTEEALLFSERPSGVTLKVSIDSGMLKPQGPSDFSADELLFIEAASKNKTALMAAAEDKIIFSGRSCEWLKVYQAALIAAAKTDAFGATQFILSNKNDSIRFSSKEERRGMVEAAFITACQSASYDVVGFYLGEALGDAYSNVFSLRPEVMAWGIYRSSPSNPAQELLELVAKKNPKVSEIYATQMRFLMLAEEGQDYFVNESLSEIGPNSPFVFREAAEKALTKGHKSTFSILLPEIPLRCLPEFVFIAGQLGAVEVADQVIQQVSKTQYPHFRFSANLELETVQPDHPEYFKGNLLAQGIKGAVAGGRLETVKIFAERLNQTGRCMTAAESAITHNQPMILRWAISKFGEAEYPDSQDRDPESLQKLMILALETGNKIARDILLKEKGVQCTNSKQIEMIAKNCDLESYVAFIAVGVSTRNLSFAVRKLCGDKELNFGSPTSINNLAFFIVDLFSRVLAAERAPSVSTQDDNINLSEALAELSLAKQPETIGQLLINHRTLARREYSEGAFYNSIRANDRQTFDLLLPLATHEGIIKCFNAITGQDRNLHPPYESTQLLPALIDAGANSPELLLKGARYLSNLEASNKSTKPTGSLMIINHPLFPTDCANALLISTGLNGNAVSKQALMDKPGVNRAIGELYQAAIDSNLTEIARLIPSIAAGDEEVLLQSACYCLKNKFPDGARQIIRQSHAQLDLGTLLSQAQDNAALDVIEQIVNLKVPLTCTNLQNAASQNDRKQLEILMRGINAMQAAKELVELCDTSPRAARKLGAGIDLIAYLRERIASEER